jgi:hypothetical protein
LIIILKKLQRKYSFDDFQERLYNADEIWLNTKHNPPTVASGRIQPYISDSGTGIDVTLTGWDIAKDQQIPSYLVFL